MILCRCVPEDAVPLMRGDGVYYGNGDRSKGATSISSRFLFRLDFEAFMFLGTTNKLFFSCVLCQNRCEMVSQGATNEKGQAKESGKEVGKRDKAKGSDKNVC